jgi:hypothetical protein
MHLIIYCAHQQQRQTVVVGRVGLPGLLTCLLDQVAWRLGFGEPRSPEAGLGSGGDETLIVRGRLKFSVHATHPVRALTPCQIIKKDCGILAPKRQTVYTPRSLRPYMSEDRALALFAFCSMQPELRCLVQSLATCSWQLAALQC